MHSNSAEITALVGREVYTSNGMFVGEVEDLRLNIQRQTVTGLALTDLGRSELCVDSEKVRNGVMVPYRAVRKVGDVILVYEFVEDAFNGPE